MFRGGNGLIIVPTTFILKKWSLLPAPGKIKGLPKVTLKLGIRVKLSSLVLVPQKNNISREW